MAPAPQHPPPARKLPGSAAAASLPRQRPGLGLRFSTFCMFSPPCAGAAAPGAFLKTANILPRLRDGKAQRVRRGRPGGGTSAPRHGLPRRASKPPAPCSAAPGPETPQNAPLLSASGYTYISLVKTLLGVARWPEEGRRRRCPRGIRAAQQGAGCRQPNQGEIPAWPRRSRPASQARARSTNALKGDRAEGCFFLSARSRGREGGRCWYCA